jgi:hypothetical protein
MYVVDLYILVVIVLAVVVLAAQCGYVVFSSSLMSRKQQVHRGTKKWGSFIEVNGKVGNANHETRWGGLTQEWEPCEKL